MSLEPILWRMWKVLLGFVLAAPLASGAPADPDVEGPFYTNSGEVIVSSGAQPIFLHNNPHARDQPLERVLAFLASNTVNRRRYTDGKWVCGEYAVSLHDRAEANGFRCALVILRFREGPGHALNAFQTTDRGLVFIDCTGCREGDTTDVYDTVGYIQIGQPYGRLSLPLAVQGPFDYRFYSGITASQKDLQSLEKKINEEYAQLSAERSRLQQVAGTATNDPVATFENRKAQERLRERVEEYRQQLSNRQTLATYLGVQFLENKTPVREFQVFW